MGIMKALMNEYPWTRNPLVVSAPMRLISLAPLAVAVSRAGGLGFLAAGTDLTTLNHNLQEAADLISKSPIHGTPPSTLPIGIGFINWGVDLDVAIESIAKFLPAAVWFFASRKITDLVDWARRIREITFGKTHIWIQVGTVSDALEAAKSCNPDMLVIQGADAGGHGLARGAGIITLLPEVVDALNEANLGNIALVAAGGIVEGRGAAACLAIGASGVAMGTRFLACNEASLAKGYQEDVLRRTDGGVSTVRTVVYDTLRGTTDWPERYDARGIINASYLDVQDGVITEENKTLYAKELEKGDQGWGEQGRLTTYAGTGVGLIKEVLSAQDILEEIRNDVKKIATTFAEASFDTSAE